jgi:hypothetical protein
MSTIRIPRLFGTPATAQLDRIEAGYIFRVTRAVPTGLIAVATLALVIALLAVLYSLVPPRPIHEPAPAVIPPEVRLTLDEVRQYIAPAAAPASSGAVVSQTATTATAAAPMDSAWVQLATRVHAIRRLFPEREYPWNDRYESYCTSEFFGTCYSTAQRQVAWGVSSAVMQAVNLYSSGDQETWVPVPGTGEGYALNVTEPAKKLAALAELETMLKATPVSQRRDVVVGWTSLRREREQQRLAQIGSENQRVEAERAAEFARHEAGIVARRGIRGFALMTIGGSIMAVWMLGLTLALLAIERNTRPGREVVQPGTGVSMAGASAAVPALT